MLVGISGKIGSGKDTLAAAIVSKKPEYEIRRFADKLKLITSILSGTTLPDNYTQEGKNIYLKEWGMTLGEMQQKVGTDAIRVGLHPQAWILSLYADYRPEKSNWIITDCRFKNEALSVRERGGVLIRVEGDPNKVRANSKRDMTHPSETDLDDWTDWDYKFTNIPPIENLNSHVNEIIKKFKL